jgi:hypothetical protein
MTNPARQLPLQAIQHAIQAVLVTVAHRSRSVAAAWWVAGTILGWAV